MPTSSSAAVVEQLLQETAEAVERAGGRCLAVPADVREPDQVQRLVDAAMARFGAIDVLVDSAGGQFTAAAEDISDGGWRAVHRLSVDAVWTLTRTVAVRSMIPRRGGLIVFVGFSPLRGMPGFAHASAARAAVANLAAGLALGVEPPRIRTVCLALGTILTEGLHEYRRGGDRGLHRSVPLGRLGTPAEVAAMIAFLATSAGAYITGTTITIDGGAGRVGPRRGAAASSELISGERRGSVFVITLNRGRKLNAISGEIDSSCASC